MSYRMIIDTLFFDMDGVIVDSNPAIIQAWSETRKEYGYAVPNQIEITNYILGASHHYTLAHLFPNESDMEKQIIQSKVNKREERIDCDLIAGVKTFLYQLKQKPIKLGLVTGSWPEKIHHVLTRHQLELFDCIISRQDVAKGKPDPQPYLLAMHRLNALPEHTLVFEDADNGIQAALAAGTHCIAVNNHNHSELLSINDFTDCSIGDQQPVFCFNNSQEGIRIRK